MTSLPKDNGPNKASCGIDSEPPWSDDPRDWPSNIRPFDDPGLEGFGYDNKGNVYFKGTRIGRFKRFSRFTRAVAALSAGAALVGAAASALSAPLEAEVPRREDEVA